MAWQSNTIDPATTTPAADISKIKNDLGVLKTVIQGGTDPGISSAVVTTAGGQSIAGGLNVAVSGGNVGIGITVPVNNTGYGGLSINGPTGAIISMMQGTAETFRITNATGYSFINTTGATPLLIGTNATERMRITDAGNVGIGTNSPWEKLSLPFNNAIALGSSTYSFKITRSSSGELVTTFSDTYDASTARVDFTMRSGAPAQNTAMSILGTGNVGIGTTSPLTKFDVAGVVTVKDNPNAIAGTTIESDNTGNTTIKQFYAGYMAFGTNNTERMRIDRAGNIGLGVTPSAWGTLKALELGGAGGSYIASAGLTLYAGSNNYYNGANYIYKADGYASQYQQIGGSHAWYSAAAGTAGNPITFNNLMTLYSSGTLVVDGPVQASTFQDVDNTAYYLDPANTGTSLNVAGSIIAAGNVTAYSDIRVKANIEPIHGALDKLSQINGVTYTRADLDDKERRYGGVIAQEIEAVMPEAVFDNGGKKAVDYNATIGLLIEAIKEQQSQINELKLLVHQLKGN